MRFNRRRTADVLFLHAQNIHGTRQQVNNKVYNKLTAGGHFAKMEKWFFFFHSPSSNISRVRDSLWECSQRGTSNTPKCFFRCLHCQMRVFVFLSFFSPRPACPPSDTLVCKSSAERHRAARRTDTPGICQSLGKLQMDLIRGRGQSKRCDPKGSSTFTEDGSLPSRVQSFDGLG